MAPGDRVLLFAENRPEWAIADLAIMAAGGVTVPAYTTNTTENNTYLLNHSGAAAAFVSTDRLAARLLPAVARAPALKLVVSMEPLAEVEQLSVPVLAWAEALALGEQSAAPSLDPATALTRDDLACFIYTSGTGGNPKGVMLTHGNILANVAGAHAVLETLVLGDDEVFLSFLPLSHAYEHTAGQFLPLAVGAQIYYADGLEALASNFVEVRPTIVACVPRLYEVMRQRILRMTARQPGLKAKLFAKTVALGSKAYERPEAMGLAEKMLDRLLDKLVRDAVRARFGGRIKALVSGGAPLNYDVGLFFTALGVQLFQGYGLTECSPVISVNGPGQTKLHTVGRPIPGMEVKIADDGEILARGPSVMRGYWRDESGTAQVLRDGWLHTGDVGVIDQDGFLQITDRKKDIIVNSGGDNIAPQRVEGVLALQPEIAQVIVYGDGAAASGGADRPRCRVRQGLRAAAPVAARSRRAGAAQGFRAGDRRGGRARERKSVGDRARAPLPADGGGVHGRERDHDADAQAETAADLSPAQGAVREHVPAPGQRPGRGARRMMTANGVSIRSWARADTMGGAGLVNSENRCAP